MLDLSLSFSRVGEGIARNRKRRFDSVGTKLVYDDFRFWTSTTSPISPRIISLRSILRSHLSEEGHEYLSLSVKGWCAIGREGSIPRRISLQGFSILDEHASVSARCAITRVFMRSLSFGSHSAIINIHPAWIWIGFVSLHKHPRSKDYENMRGGREEKRRRSRGEAEFYS